MNYSTIFKTISIITLLALLVGGIIWLIYSSNTISSQDQAESPSVAEQNSSQSANIRNADKEPLIIGDPNAEVTIIEYADYKCPNCGKYHSDVGRRIRKDYVETGDVKIIFRPYPVYAIDGAQALIGSYCAQQQGKFTEYYDGIFEFMWVNHFQHGDDHMAIEPVLTESMLAKLFIDIGVNKQLYDTCMDDGAAREAYDQDVLLAGPDEIQGTPSFIIGGQKIVGVQPYNVFQTLLDIELQ